MAQNKTLRIYLGLRDYWYITFLDEKGIERHLPVGPKLFGKWTEGGCLRVQLNGHRSDVFRVATELQPDSAKVLSDFTKQYPHVAAYLRYVNNMKE